MYSQLPTLPLPSRKSVSAVTLHQSYDGRTIGPMTPSKSVMENTDQIHTLLVQSILHISSLGCCPQGNNLWHKLSLDTLKNVDTSNGEWHVGENLNLELK